MDVLKHILFLLNIKFTCTFLHKLYMYLQTVVTQYFVNNKSEIWS